MERYIRMWISALVTYQLLVGQVPRCIALCTQFKQPVLLLQYLLACQPSTFANMDSGTQEDRQLQQQISSLLPRFSLCYCLNINLPIACVCSAYKHKRCLFFSTSKSLFKFIVGWWCLKSESLCQHSAVKHKLVHHIRLSYVAICAKWILYGIHRMHVTADRAHQSFTETFWPNRLKAQARVIGQGWSNLSWLILRSTNLSTNF